MKERLLPISLVLGAALVAGCSGTEQTPSQPPSSAQASGNEHTLTASDGNFYITKLSKWNPPKFLVSRGGTSNSTPDSILVGEGERFMVKQGCEITQIDKVTGGDVVTVAADNNCLPQLK